MNSENLKRKPCTENKSKFFNKKFKEYEPISKLKSNSVTFIYFLQSKKKYEKNITILYWYFSAGIDNLFSLPCCFKNINDVEKAIEDHMPANNSSSSVYKKEHWLDAKGIYNLFYLLAICFKQLVLFFVISRD